MSVASSSTSAAAIRSTARRSRHISPLVCRSSGTSGPSHRRSEVLIPKRTYAETSSVPKPSPSPTSAPTHEQYSVSSNTTPEDAQAYLSSIFNLPPSRPFPPALALQILTHKSYRLSHQPTNLSSLSPSLTPAEENHWAANHNARLNFMGRRAIETYLSMFVHSAIALSGTDLRSLDFLKGRSLENRLDIVRHTQYLGLTVGKAWDVGKHMRWDGNPTAVKNQGAKIKGVTVEAMIGGLFTEFGSPVAHRAFHLYALPHMKGGLFDPILRERADKMAEALRRDLKGRSILLDEE